MPSIPSGFNVTGTPITSALGVGSVQGNALSISGLTFQPSAPGYSLVSYTIGPGIAEGIWSTPSGPQRGGGTVTGDIAQGPVAGTGGGGDPGAYDAAMFDKGLNEAQKPPMPLASWILLALIVAGLIKK